MKATSDHGAVTGSLAGSPQQAARRAAQDRCRAVEESGNGRSCLRTSGSELEAAGHSYDLRLIVQRPRMSHAPRMSGESRMAGWKLIETAPRDGRSVLVRCGIVPDSCHVVTYVDGAWMERSGAYVLPEEGEGSPTHWSPIPTILERTRSAVLACPLVSTAGSLILLGLGIIGGLIIENLFDLLP